MQCGYRETLVPTWDLETKQGQGNILFHDQLTDKVTEHDLCTSDARYFRIGSFRQRRTKFPNTKKQTNWSSQFVQFRDVSVNDSHNDIVPTAMRNEKCRHNFTKCVIVAF